MKTNKKINPVIDLWEQRNGQEIRICDMTDNHLQNCINLIEKNIKSSINFPCKTEGFNERKMKIFYARELKQHEGY